MLEFGTFPSRRSLAMSQWRNLVFEGGGVKGLAYAGALKVLEDQDGLLEKIERVGGSSAGAITAGLLAVKMSPEDIKKTMDETDFKEFMDDDWGVVRDTHRLLKKFGWHKGEVFKEWFRKILRKQGFNDNITFAGLKETQKARDLYMTGTNINRMYTKIFSHEHTPDIPIVDALRITMSFPFFFTAVRHKDDIGGEVNQPGDSVFIDGGLLRNYPINLFDNKAYIEEEERWQASISADYASADEQASGYVYNSPELLGKEFNVYGDSGSHTKELAFKLVEFCLRGKKVYDAEGNALVLEGWE